ncbi:MAG: hypothetical protein JNK87_06835 [Bryobacterales bacterium]|nr:hypothetical protein [Bryobacterales bacterium]
MMQRKSKMVSFRLSPEEYRKLNDACELQGLGSISELARAALQRLMTNGTVNLPLAENSLAAEITDLRSRVQSLSADIDRLAARLQTTTK